MSEPASKPAVPSGFVSLDNLKWLIEKLTLPLVSAAITIVFQWNVNQRSRAEIAAADQRAQAESRNRLYTGLLHKREVADTAVRRAVFDKLMDRHLNPDPKDMDDKLVALALLAVNFHDSLNLSPLFWQIDRQMSFSGARGFAKPLPMHLAAVPSIALPTEGCVAIEALTRSGQGASTLEVNASCIDSDAQRGAIPHQRRWIFWVDLHDFPLVTFTPLSHDERFALVLDRDDDGFGLAWLRMG